MVFKISDDNDDNDIIVVNGETETEISAESFQCFISGGKPVDEAVSLKLNGKGEKERVAEINSFVLDRIIDAVKAEPKHRTEWILKHAATTLDFLAKQAGLELNNSSNNALGLYRKAKQHYVLQELAKHATDLNETVGVPVKGSILDSDKPRFTSRLFHAIAEEVEKEQPNFSFEYVAGRKTENIRYDQAVGLAAVNHLKSKRIKIQKAAKAANRELTDEESIEVAQIGELITECWRELFSGAKTIVGASEKLFPETVGTGRTTTSAVFKGVCTMDSINFGAFEL